MKTNKIVTGNLICDNKEKGTYVFLKAGKAYVFLDEINSISDLLKLKLRKLSIQKFDTDESKQKHIAKESLSPFYKKDGIKTLRKIKKDYLVDARNKAGLNY